LSRFVRQTATLDQAWRRVRSNALRSDSPLIVQEAHEFDAVATVRLSRLQKSLRLGNFSFAPAKGVLIKKNGKKSKRPVVIAPIESRIVQRALLDALYTIPEIQAELHAGFNFGGISGAKTGVPAAIAKAVTAANAHGYYIRTDIKAFFTRVPRETAVGAVLRHVTDPDFAALFKKAAETELADIGGFSAEDLRLFPLAESGVAQGSCLSPLLCNMLLADFDRSMNGRGITCIRYIDDFILFAKNRSTAIAAFSGALKRLDALGLSAYDPFSTDPEECRKANHGTTVDGLEFLGCEITPTNIRPSRANWKGMLARIDASFVEALIAIRQIARSPLTIEDGPSVSFSKALVDASNIVRGWGNTYQFCSDDRLMDNLDLEINKRTLKFYEDFIAVAQDLKKSGRLRIALGVFSLSDCKRDDESESARTIAKRSLMHP
jgi:retron-type reverse transcriptase